MNKSTFFILILSFFSIQFFAQNLYVGISDPNEILEFTSGTHIYDTIIVVQNGTLNIVNADVIVNDIIALGGTGNVNASGSGFHVNKTFFCSEDAVVNLQDEVNLQCDIILEGNSKFNISGASVNILMTYKNQYGWWVYNTSELRILNSNLNLGNGSLQGIFTDNSIFEQNNCNYTTSMLAMTVDLKGNSQTSVDFCTGGMEFVVSEAADVNINESTLFIVWYTFSDNDIADYTLPPVNSVYNPNASDISGMYNFPGAAPGITGVDFNVSINNTDWVYWGVISESNSNVILNNSTLIAYGFLFRGNTNAKVSGFVNDSLYTYYEAPIIDRSCTLNNSKVAAWNFYTAENAQLTIEDCYYGESLTFGDGKIEVFNSTCDGTGGYWGGHNNSVHNAYNSTIIRETGTSAIINADGDNIAHLHNCEVVGDIVISGNAKLFLGNTIYDSFLVVNNSAVFAEIFIDETDYIANSVIPIYGHIDKINGLTNLSEITRYKLEYSLPDSTQKILMKDSVNSSILINGELAQFNTQDIPAGDYLLWGTLFLDGDTAINYNFPITMTTTSLTDDLQASDYNVYPNPFSEKIYIKGDDIMRVALYDVNGKLIYKNEMVDSMSLSLNLNQIQKGLYFLEINNKEKVMKFKIIKQ